MGEVLYEFVQIGQQMRVSAIDADTNVEVIVIAPIAATRHQMQVIALAKLKKRLAELSAAEPPQRLF
ncbi:hypothetical protein VE25_13145 [Devosia geojensis]|uniref:DUF6898 domain-containing protein n=1 Tax=Devosia geojensis TaxID=443610 RepID=A0A0F5FRQ8_9HYPH|nr:hypothetical protein [Devosia geojensis]KKB11265.1 hypothetical protein VE25_13145 [Devosia geojensis]